MRSMMAARGARCYRHALRPKSRKGNKDYASLKGALDAWFDEVRKASWSSTAEVKRLLRIGEHNLG
ncbi:MAG TPA: hypothetical protein VFA50_13710 [Stellaceae bacterium]|nr:hypothetical protein [Stellaceae bacterium]